MVEFIGGAVVLFVALYFGSLAVLNWQERRDARRSVMADAARQHKREQDIGFFGGRQS